MKELPDEVFCDMFETAIEQMFPSGMQEAARKWLQDQVSAARALEVLEARLQDWAGERLR